MTMTMPMTADDLSATFAALADPTRRAILARLALGEATVGEIAEPFPISGPAEFARQPQFCGVPFLAPWANRVDGDGFWANGKRYVFNSELGLQRRPWLRSQL